eukprot:CAMPEP_0116136280 /NCGR_PEP_ID=MMETSP0329-20121206/11637_1 /TAXON_ID=697910 /ORGANISM="Pseudo-nitzschia arenysensis, Strain B593" /LENGTH=536 /DNA_ID=CAMNT_0003631131 /DNA_START=145 /DNA_END=1755 /DNA_ORIENTATION=+
MAPLSNEGIAVAERQDDLDPKRMDTLLSKELMQLSFQDRNNITEEIHGVQSLAVNESTYTRDEGLTKLQYEIDSLPSSEKEAYSLAQTLPVTYVNDSAFRLRFLRADFFDTGEAAKRMVGYLDLVLQLFGIEALKRPLKTTDFKSKEEKSVLKGGLVQLLPYRDRSGRRVMVILSDIMSQNHFMRVKIFLYLLTVAAECEETQQKGVVFVLWPGKNKNVRIPPTEERLCCRKSFGAFPVRLAGFHFCWPDTPFFHMIKSFFVLVMGSKTRVRVNFHSGQRQELAYKLMGFGIPIQLLPTTESGVIKTKNHNQWFKMRQLLEKHAGNSPTTQPANLIGAIECPALNDVLYERTKPCNFHPGNSRFKGIIEEKKEEHTMLSQTGKRDFAWSIVEEIEMRNGRFLRWDRASGFWVQLRDRSEIRLKVATSLRDFNKHSRAVAKVQTVASVCKLSVDDGQEVKKRRVVVSDDESSHGGQGSSNNSIASGGNAGGGCLSSLFDFKPDSELFKLDPIPISNVSSDGMFAHVVKSESPTHWAS